MSGYQLAVSSVKPKFFLPAQCHVQLCFTEKSIREFMWVKVDDKEEGCDVYYGVLEDHPTSVGGLQINDIIQFTPDNVYQIIW